MTEHPGSESRDTVATTDGGPSETSTGVAMSREPGPVATEPEPHTTDRAAEEVSGSLDVTVVHALCPYLLAAELDWRAATAAREHRCTAVAPAAALSVEKQRRTCLTESHRSCSTFLAARHALVPTDQPDEATGTVGGSSTQPSSGRPVLLRWPVPRTAPVVLERGRPSLRAIASDRSVTQVALVVLMVVAFGVLAIARLTAGPATPATPSPSPAPSAVPGATVSPAPSPSPAASAVPSSSPSPSEGATASPSPSTTATRTYRVRSGDTLTAIAARFGTSVAALEAANELASPSLIRVGQVLVIP